MTKHQQEVARLTNKELRMEFRDLWMASWNGAAEMPPRRLTGDAQNRLAVVQSEMAQRGSIDVT